MLSGHWHFLPCGGASRPRGDSGGPCRVFCEMALQKSWWGGGPCRRPNPFPALRVSLPCPPPPMSALDRVWLGHVGDLNLAPFISVLPRRKTLSEK